PLSRGRAAHAGGVRDVRADAGPLAGIASRRAIEGMSCARRGNTGEEACHMRTLRDLYAYNVWANARVFAECRDLDRAQLEQDAPGRRDTLIGTLGHMVHVEEVYLYLLRGEPPQQVGPQDAYFAHDLAWFAERAAQIGAQYLELLAGAADTYYDEQLRVPW